MIFFKGLGFFVFIIFLFTTLGMTLSMIFILDLLNLQLDKTIIIGSSIIVASIINFIVDRRFKKYDGYLENTFIFIHMHYWTHIGIFFGIGIILNPIVSKYS